MSFSRNDFARLFNSSFIFFTSINSFFNRQFLTSMVLMITGIIPRMIVYDK